MSKARATWSGVAADGGRRPPMVHPGMLLPFVLLVVCFAAWGVAANMTDTLVPTFQAVFSMGAAQSTLVQSAYYGAYFLLALPAAFINSRLGYKSGVLIGLLCAAVGGLLFVPAAGAISYPFFLFALFLLAAGLSVLETSANPFVMAMGPKQNATRRLNLAQSFNPIGTNAGVALATLLILSNISQLDAEERAALPPAELEAVQSEELRAVLGPYVGLALVLVAIAAAIFFVRLPRGSGGRPSEVDLRGHRGVAGRLLRNRRYLFGVVAQYFNIAAQTGIWTFTIGYTAQAVGASPGAGGVWLQAGLLLFLVARFAMTALMGRIDPRRLLLLMTSLGVVLGVVVVLSPNLVGAVALVAMSACLSLLFPTIYGLALTGLGRDTKFGAAGLVMAIVGGATLPLLQGAIADASTVAVSYLVPTLCFAVVVGYAVYVLRQPGVPSEDVRSSEPTA